MKERRVYPRVEKNIPFKIYNEELDILAETKNISANGAYICIDKNLNLLTKLKITMLIPFLSKENSIKRVKKIYCEGVVVRKEENEDNNKFPYSIAIYFNFIKEKDRKILINYINYIKSNQKTSFIHNFLCNA